MIVYFYSASSLFYVYTYLLGLVHRIPPSSFRTHPATVQVAASVLGSFCLLRSTKLLHAAAKCIVNPLGEDPIAVPAHHHGKAWAARQYFMSTYSGPREGECSEHPVPLGWLDQMMEDGHLPRDLKVWRVDGGKAWVSLGQEIKAEIKAELKAEKKKAAEASTSV